MLVTWHSRPLRVRLSGKTFKKELNRVVGPNAGTEKRVGRQHREVNIMRRNLRFGAYGILLASMFAKAEPVKAECSFDYHTYCSPDPPNKSNLGIIDIYTFQCQEMSCYDLTPCVPSHCSIDECNQYEAGIDVRLVC